MRAFALLFFALAAGAQVHRFGRFEQTFTAANQFANPLTDAQLIVEFEGPGKTKDIVSGFWDGGKQWKVRFSPELPGQYRWKTTSADAGLNAKSGSFTSIAYKGRNPLYRDGGPRLSFDRRYLVQSGAKPWFFLSDTAWNGALLSTAAEWKQYLDDRAAKRFTAVQFVMTQWRAGRKDERGDVAFTGTNPVRVNPRFFQRMDEKMTAVNDAGLVAVPVMLWALTSKDNESPGVALNADQAAALAGYMAARYAAHKVIWFLGGDGDYSGANLAKWKQIGRSVFPEGRKRHLAGLHPRGMRSPWEDYKDEGWLDLFLYQSGHGGDTRKWQWNATQGPAAGWQLNPPHPVIDAEPNYEAHLSYSGRKIDDYDVRRAAYYSLLGAPPAGVSYGAHGIWFWSRKAEVPLDHPKTGVAEPWERCLDYSGAKQMKILRDIFDSIEWWRLRPDRALLSEDKFADDYSDFIMPSLAEEDDLAMIYLPKNPAVKLNLAKMEMGTLVGSWVDPRTGKQLKAGQWGPDRYVELKTPGPGDWLLIVRRR